MTANDTVDHIEIAGTDLNFRSFPATDQTPAGLQLARMASFSADDHVYVLQLRNDGELEDVRNVESVRLTDGNRFVIAENDRSFRLAVDGDPFDWAMRFITEATLRKLRGIGDDKVILLEKVDEPDQMLEDDDLIDLNESGVERFKTRKGVPTKKQNVQVKHLGELETAKFKVAETSTIQQIWERAYIELEIGHDDRDVFQADVRGGSVSLMDHLGLTLIEAQRRGLCDKKFEISARTGGA